MSHRDEYKNLLRGYGFHEGTIDLLAEMFNKYEEQYLSSVASNYYSYPLLKFKDIDAALQFALDSSVQVWRGQNHIVSIPIQKATDYFFIRPLGDFFSYGSHYFYYGGDTDIYISPSDKLKEEVLKGFVLIHSTTPKRTVKSKTREKIILIRDDSKIISSHVAVFIEYELEGIRHREVLPYTEDVSLFWDYLPEDERKTADKVYHALILTIPGYGIGVVLSDHIISGDKNRDIIVEYINFDQRTIPEVVLQRLLNHFGSVGLIIYDNTSASPVGYPYSIMPPNPPYNLSRIQKYLTDSTRHNGTVRSITDILRIIEDSFNHIIYDIKLYHYISNKTPHNKNLPNIFYIIVIYSYTTNFFSFLSYYFNKIRNSTWHRNYPVLNVYPLIGETDLEYNYIVANDTQSVEKISINPSDIILVQPVLAKLIIEYDYQGRNNENVKYQIYDYVYKKYVKKIIETLEPGDIFNFFNKIDYVEKPLFFMISIEIPCGDTLIKKTVFRFHNEESTRDYPAAYNQTSGCASIYASIVQTTQANSEIISINTIRVKEFYEMLVEKNFELGLDEYPKFIHYFIAFDDLAIIDL